MVFSVKETRLTQIALRYGFCVNVNYNHINCCPQPFKIRLRDLGLCMATELLQDIKYIFVK